MDLLTAVGSARSIANVVEGGRLADEVADLGIEAAKDALKKVPHANDKRREVESAINHLEGAEVALRRYSEKGIYRNVLSVTSAPRVVAAMYKRRYILGLMAICYRYLGEENLTNSTLSTIENLDKEIRGSIYGDGADWAPKNNDLAAEVAHFAQGIVGGVVGFLNPLNYPLIWRVNRTGHFSLQEHRFDLAAFRRRLTATWNEASGSLLNTRELGL